MRKVHDKSIILGIGIGMIITAIAGMIFSAGNQKELSKAEIIKLAKGYGLIEQVKFLNDNNDSIDSTNVTASSSTNKTATGDTSADKTATVDTSADKSATGDSSAVESTLVESNTTNSTTERNIIIKIKKGSKAQDIIDVLLEKGVITSGEDFTNVLFSYKASRKINFGTFMFSKNEDLHYVVKTICDLK